VDAKRFDTLVRNLAAASTRRAISRLLAGSALGFGIASRLPDPGGARKGKKKRLRRNQFGCVNVGDRCRGNDDNCCSGICQGKKPKQGKQDKSRCVGHDAGIGCQAGVREEGCGGTDIDCTTSTGQSGICDTTTGNGPYCVFGFACVSCRKDADCQDLCGSAAACIICPGCDGFETACVGPSAGDCLP
jgi:hypothetical protein